ncbi:hypothetical protein MYCTH_2108695 [Thermothelomyces thermophilus ATCC 42464]|uniref:Uncharacterized protein n=1 Tax=Thermothelomyces thermophilus (strain ATCC 42464 / BCRC 31852 / DSM 1799) TaxID=573729 RepID=G2Q7Z0_THET4|nr:uncharacterized protein MYCTH_2108695 [Thermothelomyces thermophilus ATCC 42464]AEO56147.1 hypothetical protein MYCTH_2108695 [Thermothelomyces thermophilus ATCC 42464]
MADTVHTSDASGKTAKSRPTLPGVPASWGELNNGHDEQDRPQSAAPMQRCSRQKPSGHRPTSHAHHAVIAPCLQYPGTAAIRPKTRRTIRVTLVVETVPGIPAEATRGGNDFTNATSGTTRSATSQTHGILHFIIPSVRPKLDVDPTIATEDRMTTETVSRGEAKPRGWRQSAVNEEGSARGLHEDSTLVDPVDRDPIRITYTTYIEGTQEISTVFSRIEEPTTQLDALLHQSPYASCPDPGEFYITLSGNIGFSSASHGRPQSRSLHGAVDPADQPCDVTRKVRATRLFSSRAF